MPKTPATPTDPPAAVVPTGGAIFNSSAGPAVDASADGALSGPHFIQQQAMFVMGARSGVRGARNTAASSFCLSAQEESYLVGGTQLISQLWVMTVNEKSYENFATSSFYQPQKFTLYPGVTDYQGNTYNLPIGYQFGPSFYIATTQTGIKRELWDDNNPSHYVSSISKGMWTAAAAKWEAGAWIWNDGDCNQEQQTHMKAAWAHPEQAHSYLDAYGWNSVSWREIMDGPARKWIPGPYNTNAEVSTLSNLQEFVDYLGQEVQSGVMAGADGCGRTHFYLRAGEMGSQRNGLSSLPAPSDPNYAFFHQKEFPDYDWTLHDWS